MTRGSSVAALLLTVAAVCLSAVVLETAAQSCPYRSSYETSEALSETTLQAYRIAANYDTLDQTEHPTHREYQSYDGFYNNIAHPDWGVADSNLLRLLFPAYDDATYRPANRDGPNPITVSRETMDGESGLTPVIRRNVLFTHFGQQVVEEILDAQRNPCVPEYVNIPLPNGAAADPLYSNYTQGFIPLVRGRFNYRTGYAPGVPREQLTEISAFIDGTLMYGPNKPWADTIRAHRDGKLAEYGDTSLNPRMPIKNSVGLPIANPPVPIYYRLLPAHRQYLMGNPRTNENPMLAAMGVIWFREHNYHAERLSCMYPNWSDDELFLEARKWTIAIHQHITFDEFLPLFVSRLSARYGELATYTGYRDYVNPQISHVFQTAAMRIGHTFVTPGVYRRSRECDFGPNNGLDNAIRTCNVYFRPAEIYEEYANSFEELVLGMVSQLTEKEDHIITEDLRGFVFGPLEAVRRDLMAINIQRARDHGVPNYNVARKFFGLEEAATFEDIPHHANTAPVIERLKTVYEDKIENLDIWAGGLMETELFEGPGELFSAVILDQFLRIRDGDRFWYEAYEHNHLFTEEEIDLIKETTFGDVVARALDIERDHFRHAPEGVAFDPFEHSIFIAPDGTADGGQCPQPAGQMLSTANLEACSNPGTYDYFTVSYDNSDLPLTVALGLGGWTFLSICVMLFFVRRGKRQRQLLRNTAASISKQAEHRRSTRTFDDTGKGFDRDTITSLNMEDPTKPEHLSHMFKGRLRPHGFLSNAELEVVFVDIDTEAEEGPAINIYTIDGYVIQSIAIDDVRAFHNGPLFRSVYISCASGTGTSLLFNMLEGAKFLVRLEHVSERALTSIVHGDDEDLLQVAEAESQAAINLINKAIEFGLAREVFAGSVQAQKYEIEDVRKYEMCLKHLRLSPDEFAGLIGMPPEHTFVISLFNFADFNGDGFLSGSELVNVLKPFSEPNKAKRTRLMFKFYDSDGSGRLDRDELHEFVISLYALTGLSDISDERAEILIQQIFQNADLNLGVDCDEFVAALLEQQQLQDALDRLLPGHHQDKAGDNLAPSEQSDDVNTGARKSWLLRQSESLSAKKLEVFWFLAFVISTALIFYERFYHYQVDALTGGLKRITGNGVATTRGGASAMIWCYSLILLPLCRNTITFLRGTFVSKIIPLDSAIEFHKLVAGTGFVFLLVHLVGHTVNFYNISTQPAADVGCLFRQVFWSSNFLPHFGWWVFETATGLAGFLLTLVSIIMYTMSIKMVRRASFVWFWNFHHLYVAFFFLLYLHGAARLVQEPFLFYFNLGPALLFTIDKLVSLSRSHHDLEVYEAILLPSGVLCLQMEKPPGFENMQSGQWLRIKCSAVSTNEWHPFTISSPPQENYVSVHIRTAGPWTAKIRKVFAEAKNTGSELPRVQIEGPYGEIHQDWLSSQAAVFVGGGIGVTPYASILEDLAWRFRNKQEVSLDKVHFIWVTRTQKEYEWMVELLKDVQEDIPADVLEVSIYMTQAKKNYDLRTSLLFMFEHNNVEGNNQSILTGLRATTNFQRPDFRKLLPILRDRYAPRQISIFTCGPPALANNVENGTRETNESSATTIPLRHFFVSF